MQRFKRAMGVSLMVAALVCGLGVGSTSAQLSPDPADGPGIRVLAEHTPAEITLDRYLVRMGRHFRWLDGNADGVLTRGDAEFHAAMQMPRDQLSVAKDIMRSDLDGDGVVTRDEALRMARYELRSETKFLEKVESEVRCLMTLDIDQDGRITLAEAMKKYRPPLIRYPGSRNIIDRVQDALTLSSGQNGQVTLADFENAATTLFRAIDVDGDGKMSLGEVSAYRRNDENPGSRERIRAAKEAAHQREVAAAREVGEAARNQPRRDGC